MRKTLLVLTAVALAGCQGGALTPQAMQIFSVLCQDDSVLQPIAVSIAPTVLPSLSSVVLTDQVLVHPIIVDVCAQLGKAFRPVGVTAGTPAAK